MGIFSNLFGRKSADTEQKVGGMEDFMTLIRVYFQAVIASDLGITNLNALPDLRVFKVKDSGCADLSAAVPDLCTGCDDAVW